ncbi:hypothetical protein EO98_01275 [Methanosarcina sp. 2.H.T.1A.6]|nr:MULTISPECIES: ABC transporter ATP-binding protein [unclassified Methanosarcina]KKG14905.1 hypothetical protein EO94_13340 [Methanosarcina sp. 2.H.T.1A.3]KKG21031.1 hypothetical protein EO98_01275 [Methanosarcina sp. 2.H.T.1A.6]KKG27280.1 hypothetical protein EO96_10110 [Methanosarcina sp. 2.H.T.1A.8]
MIASKKEEPIIEVKHLSKQYSIGMDTTYKTLSESLTSAVRHPLKTLKDCRRQNDTFWALKDVNFKVERGEVVGVIGRNGAGKSTLLKILSRITYPTEGEITMRGRVGSLLEVGTGFHPELTGRENIYFNGSILGMKKREIDEKFDEIVKFSGVEKFLDTPVKRYSSGMQVRLAFSVAAHLEPEILLVDEVLAVGDAAFQKKCLGKMGEVAKEGRTVLFVSHQIDMIKSLCRNCMLLSEGNIISIGEVNEVVDQYMNPIFYGNDNVSFNVRENKNIDLQILEGRVISKSEEICGIFDVFDIVKLEITYVVQKPLIGSVVNFEIRRNGSLVALSFDTDLNNSILELRNPGIYHCIITLPHPLFKPGHYTITFNTGIINSTTFQRLEEIICFEIQLLSQPSSLLSYADKRPGIIALPVPWEVKNISGV